MPKNPLCLFALAALLSGPAGALAQEHVPADDHLQEHHREQCADLDKQEHDVRVQLARRTDRDEIDHMEQRLEEIAADRDKFCRAK